MARRIFFKEQSNLGVAPNGYSILGFNTNNRAIKTDESGVVKLIESVYTDENNTIVIGASGGTGSVSVNGYYELPNYAPTSGKVLGLSGSSLHWITAGGGGLQGSGTTNYLAKWNSGGLTGSLIYDDGSNVGLNYNSPSARLHIKGNSGNETSLLTLEGFTNIDNFLLTKPSDKEGRLVVNAGVALLSLTDTSTSNYIYISSGYGVSIFASNRTSTYFTNNTSGGYHSGFRSNGNWVMSDPNNSLTIPSDTKLSVYGSTISAPTTMRLVGSDSTSTNYSLKIDNISGNSLLYVRNDGTFQMNNPYTYQGTSFYYNRKNGYDGDFWFNPNQTNGGISSNLYLNIWQTRWGAPSSGASFAQTNLALMSISDGGIYMAINTHKLNPPSGNIPLQVAYEKGSGAGGPAKVAFFQYNDSYSINAPGTSLIEGVVIDNYSGTWTNAGVGGSRRVGLNVYVGNSTYNHSAIFRGGNISVSTSVSTVYPDSSALIEMSSTTQGFLPPRMTTTERNNISSPAQGLVIFNTTTTKLECYDGTTWQQAW